MPKKRNISLLPWITKEKALPEIRRIASQETESLIILNHARDRQQLRDVTDRQILNVLKNGELTGQFEWDTQDERGWKCKLSRITAGDHVSVIAKLVERDGNKCLIITVWN
jgi:hypothetical protein